MLHIGTNALAATALILLCNTGAPMLIPDTRTLGRIVRERRRAVGLTAVRAAAMAGISRRLLGEFERGTRRNVGTKAIFRILDLLGLKMEVEPRGSGAERPVRRASHRA